MTSFVVLVFVVVLTEISPNENQDSWRLLLLHLWSTGGTAGSCCSLRLHGSGNDRRYQVSIMMERKRERGNQSTNAIDPSTAVRVAFRDRLHPARTTESAISLLTTAKHDRVESPPLCSSTTTCKTLIEKFIAKNLVKNRSQLVSSVLADKFGAATNGWMCISATTILILVRLSVCCCCKRQSQRKKDGNPLHDFFTFFLSAVAVDRCLALIISSSGEKKKFFF